MKNLNREINLNKKFIVIFMLINIIALALYYSYALFQINVIQDNIVVVNTAPSIDLNFSIAEQPSSNNITLASGESKTITINLTSSSNSSVGYKLFYYKQPGDSSTFTVSYSGTETFANNILQGVMKSSKQLILTFTNTGSKSLTMTLGAKAGYAGSVIKLETSYNLILGETHETVKSRLASKIQNSQCTSSIVEDGTIYLSGDAECVKYNYVWYSGKLWRATAIYPDGTVKLVTEDLVSTFLYAKSTDPTFYTNSTTSSHLYKFLNNDFLNTLYNYSNIIVTNATWNATRPSESIFSVKPAETNMVTASVGALNSYEYYLAAYNASTAANRYLNDGYNWFLLNPYGDATVWMVNNSGLATSVNPTYSRAVRPAIYLKDGVVCASGNGEENYPFALDADKSHQSNSLINTRLSGEYLKFSSSSTDLYRIVGVENNTTKIIQVDYANSGATKPFALGNTNGDGTLYGSGQTTGSGTWYTYLNTTWYPTLSATYGDYFTSGSYCLANYNSNYYSTNSLCSSNDLVTFNVGLPAYGEMFAAQHGTGTAANIFLITRRSTTNMMSITTTGSGATSNVPTDSLKVYPTLHLKNTVKIISGNGTKYDPYVIGL